MQQQQTRKMLKSFGFVVVITKTLFYFTNLNIRLRKNQKKHPRQVKKYPKIKTIMKQRTVIAQKQ